MADFYELQRAMRAMRQAALQRGALAILDLGSSKIGCLILRFDGLDSGIASDQVGSLAGQTSFQVVGSAITRSRGVEFGEISSMQEAEKAIRTVLQSAQKMANLRVDHLIACFSGGDPRSYGLNGNITVENQMVRDEDIARVLSSCDLPDFGDGREILHAQPVNFALDYRTGLVDPRGQIGNNLDVDLHMLTARAKTVRDLAYCVKRCDLELAGVASAAYVSGRSALVLTGFEFADVFRAELKPHEVHGRRLFVSGAIHIFVGDGVNFLAGVTDSNPYRLFDTAHGRQSDFALFDVAILDHERRFPVTAVWNQRIIRRQFFFDFGGFKNSLHPQHLLNLITHGQFVFKVEGRVGSESDVAAFLVSHYLRAERLAVPGVFL